MLQPEYTPKLHPRSCRQEQSPAHPAEHLDSHICHVLELFCCSGFPWKPTFSIFLFNEVSDTAIMLPGMAQLAMLELSSHSPSWICVQLQCNWSKGSWWRKHHEPLGKEGKGKARAGKQLSVLWKGGLIREKVFWTRQGWQNSEMPLFLSLLFNIISFGRHISILHSL